MVCVVFIIRRSCSSEPRLSFHQRQKWSQPTRPPPTEHLETTPVLCLWFLTQQWLTGCTIGNENIIADHIVCFHNAIRSNDLTSCSLCLQGICLIYLAVSFLDVIAATAHWYLSFNKSRAFSACLLSPSVWKFLRVLQLLRHIFNKSLLMQHLNFMFLTWTLRSAPQK